MSTPVEFLSLSAAADRLATHRKRVGALMARLGLEPGFSSGRWVITEEQFAAIARAHAANPPRPRGNPDWSRHKIKAKAKQA